MVNMVDFFQRLQGESTGGRIKMIKSKRAELPTDRNLQDNFVVTQGQAIFDFFSVVGVRNRFKFYI